MTSFVPPGSKEGSTNRNLHCKWNLLIWKVGSVFTGTPVRAVSIAAVS